MIIHNAKIADFSTLTYRTGSIRIINTTITTVSFDKNIPPEHNEAVLDIHGAYLSPGLSDGHIHIESSHITPEEFSREAITHGTTSIFIDPHELANVKGRAGINYFLDKVNILPLDMYIGIPSSVPATHLETSGGEITLDDVQELLPHPHVFGLAEMMNVPAILNNLSEARAKVEVTYAQNKIIDGHCPELTGKDLYTYIHNGNNNTEMRITSDHECTNPKEAYEKYQAGMHIMLRHGSSSKDLDKILPIFIQKNKLPHRLMLVCDDISAEDLHTYGHINYLHKRATRLIQQYSTHTPEQSSLLALQMCTRNTGAYFRINIGDIRPGYRANLIIHDSIEFITPHITIHAGEIVYNKNTPKNIRQQPNPAIKTTPLNIAYPIDLAIHHSKTTAQCRTIIAHPHSLITESTINTLSVSNNIIQPDPQKGIARLCVIERHHASGSIGKAFIQGITFTHGAIATTVAHDSHNLIVLGYDLNDMETAVHILHNTGGGFVATYKNTSKTVPLDIGGLMSSLPLAELIQQQKELLEFCTKLGFTHNPYPTLSFMALPVIPELKLTDQGLVDIKKFQSTQTIVS